MRQTQITDILSIGDRQPLTLIGGPCVIESADFTLKMAEEIQKICDRLKISFIFKSSFELHLIISFLLKSPIEIYLGMNRKRGLRSRKTSGLVLE